VSVTCYSVYKCRSIVVSQTIDQSRTKRAQRVSPSRAAAGIAALASIYVRIITIARETLLALQFCLYGTFTCFYTAIPCMILAKLSQLQSL